MKVFQGSEELRNAAGSQVTVVRGSAGEPACVAETLSVVA